MSHEIDMSNNRANIAFVGETPWHGLGSPLTPDADMETWRREAGMEWSCVSSPVQFQLADGGLSSFSGRRVLYRSDTKAPLSVVSSSYNVVQPAEILEFYDELVKNSGYRLHTAGVLDGGRKYWALAETGTETRIKGQDRVAAFLLLATACDGTIATRGMFTSIRVVCANTLSFAFGQKAEYISIPHSARFNGDKMKEKLGIKEQWTAFNDEVEALADRRVTRREAVEWLVKVFGDADKPIEEQLNTKARTMQHVMALFEGEGKGSNLRSAANTAWGLVNAATEFVDHIKGREANARLSSAWFGDGAQMKKRAWDAATALLKAA